MSKKNNSGDLFSKAKKLDANRIVSVATTEYTKWIMSPKIIIYICMLIFLYEYVIGEFYRIHGLTNEEMMIFEPFISMGNSSMVYLIFPSVFMVLMSDFPKTDGNTMFYIQRCGKSNWILGQTLFAFFASLSFIAITAVLSIVAVLPKGFTSNNWSRMVTHLAVDHKSESGSRLTQFINNRMYNNMKPYTAFIYTFAFMILYLFLIAVLMMVAFSLGKRIIGIGFCAAIMALGVGMSETGFSIMWLFPATHALMWSHFDRIMKKQIMSVRISYLYFLSLIVIGIVISLIAIRHYDFAKISDMED